MDKQTLKQLTKHYQLGPIKKFTPLTGSRLNQTWRFDTRTNSFFLKALNPKHNQGKLNQQRITEQIAREFAQHLTVVTAICIQQDPITIINQQAYLLYPWKVATTKSATELKTEHRQQIAALLATIHQLNLQLDNAPPPQPTQFNWQAWQCKIEQLEQHSSVAFQQLNALNHSLLPYKELLATGIPKLTNELLISHRDLDPLNVLWGCCLYIM